MARFEQTNVTTHADLVDATSVAVSADGRFIYTSSWSKGNVTIFDRDVRTGIPVYFDTIKGDHLNGSACFRLAPSGLLGVTAAFRDAAVTLFRRDPASGGLKIVDTVQNSQRNADALEFAVEATFSIDSQYVYVGGVRAVTAFKIAADDQLETVQTLRHVGVEGVRSLAASPDNRFVYVASSGAGAVVVLERDTDTGILPVLQVIQDKFSFDGGLPGVFSVAVSPDGKNVYSSAGRFGGSNAVCVFERQEDGRLEIVQTFVQTVDLDDFVGGNEIAVSPDGWFVAALASISDRLVYFRRDPENGRLEKVEELMVGSKVNPGSAGIAFSPDGRNCYVADESSGELVTFTAK